MLQHIAIIMDGNGRWAKKQKKKRSYGHYYGGENVRNIALEAMDQGVKVLTLYAFSTENWKRPEDEIKYLMKLPKVFFDKFLDELIEKEVSVRTIGDIGKLPMKTQEVILNAVEKTKLNDKFILNFALNYGSRDEIVRTIKSLTQEEILRLDENIFSQALDTGGLPDVDLLIRTGGDRRLSNYLLWQLAYAELMFVDTAWPAFTREEFAQCIKEFSSRERRFGGL